MEPLWSTNLNIYKHLNWHIGETIHEFKLYIFMIFRQYLPSDEGGNFKKWWNPWMQNSSDFYVTTNRANKTPWRAIRQPRGNFYMTKQQIANN